MAENARPGETLSKIGPYEILKSIAKGGMGEVLLAFDPLCGREVALKRIRTDLKGHAVLKDRFLREAKITGSLTHPGVIAIYTIHFEEEQIYYTMPYVEGETLKQILRGKPRSIPALLPIFRSICQTIAYAHSKGIIHRDLKPENVLVGTFGEVVVLDWGLAQEIKESTESQGSDVIKESHPELTHPGKIVGTLAYMNPERALGATATVQTDIYALGVILYQILTLHLPFHRDSIKEFRKTHPFEKLTDPEELAPYRDVPPRLSRIVRKCLQPKPEERYQTVEALLDDIKSHLEGRSEWFESARLNVHNKSDWEFQENVLISKHIAITRTTEAADWVSVMLSRLSFAENCRLETRVYIGDTGSGIGFLLSVPEPIEREHPMEGYCLWLGSEEDPFSQLFRNTIEMMHLSDLSLKRNQWHEIIIEKIENNIHFTLDGTRRFTYISYIPLVGTHVGIMARDADFKMDDLLVSVGSQNLQVSCLSIPDAFLAAKDYKRALAEYHRIGYSFPGHAEGREALFRAGITLLEQAKSTKSEKRSKQLFTYALEEFTKLHRTPGAPLEYLGKALVYNALRDYDDEIKCLELALRRYQKHPLIGAIKEHIVYRMHESAQYDRRSAYQLILIALRLLPDVVQNTDSQRLFKHLITHWETLPFLENPIDPSLIGKEENTVHFASPLAFWLASPYGLIELFEDLLKKAPLDVPAAGNLLYSFFEIGSYGLAQSLMKRLDGREAEELGEVLALLNPLLICHDDSLEKAIQAYFALGREDIGLREFRTLSYLMQYALRTDQEECVYTIAEKIEEQPLSREDRIQLDGWRIWAYLKEERWKEAGELFEKYPLEMLNQESTILHPLYGCYLYVTEGEEIAEIHFAGVIDTPFPRSWALLGHELTNKISESPGWYNRSFMWERRRLYRQLALYYQCAENPELETYYQNLERKEYIYVPD